jgi:hypothetical protein
LTKFLASSSPETSISVLNSPLLTGIIEEFSAMLFLVEMLDETMATNTNNEIYSPDLPVYN